MHTNNTYTGISASFPGRMIDGGNGLILIDSAHNLQDRAAIKHQGGHNGKSHATSVSSVNCIISLLFFIQMEVISRY
jgi:hypothetical protein